MNRTLEYVVSGTSYMRLSNPGVSGSPENVAMINDLFTKFVHKQKSHEFSALYNAFQESSFGERFQPYRPALKHIHADSGGLQIITLGKKIDDAMKEKIYANMAKSCDVAMSFDEIPVILPSGKSDRNDTAGRIFDRANHINCAKKTGQNIKRQLEVFESLDSKCKPFAILQGNCYDTYMSWTDAMLGEVPEAWHNRLGGIAMGAAALGTGPLEDVQRAFIASQVKLRDDNNKLHLHILGVGSARRLIPYLIFCQNGLYDHIEISYDSTTHSRAAETGLYFMGNKTIKYAREFSDQYRIFYEDIEKTEPVGTTLEDFHKILNMGSGAYQEQGGTMHMWLRIRYLFVLSSVRNFMARIEQLMNDPEEVLRFAATLKLEHQFRNLYNVKTVEDFKRWESDQYLGGSMKSMPIRTEPMNTLEGLFA